MSQRLAIERALWLSDLSRVDPPSGGGPGDAPRMRGGAHRPARDRDHRRSLPRAAESFSLHPGTLQAGLDAFCDARALELGDRAEDREIDRILSLSGKSFQANALTSPTIRY